MSEACTEGFKACLQGSTPPHELLPAMSVFFAYGAVVDPKDLIALAEVFKLEEMKDCFLGGLSFVDNPFVPGLSLSVALDDSLKNAPERESRSLEALQKAMDDLLLAVLDRLPQTIADFPGGVGGCESILEPEVAGILRDGEFRGPLRLALQERQFSKTLCMAPLVFKYMSYRFVAGLPDLQDSNDLLGGREEKRTRTSFGGGGPVRAPVASTASASSVYTAASGGGGGGGAPPPSSAPSGTRRGRKGRDFLYSDGFVAGSAPERLLQGLGWTGRRAAAAETPPQERPSDWETIFSGTFLPGMQFVLVGILTKPLAYYKVPVMRMFLGFYVHLITLALYTAVALESDDGELSNTEIALTFHVAAEIVSNLLQMRAGFVEFWRDKWNWLESLSLLLLAGGLTIRILNSDVHQGRALFALSAPLVFSRVLFFGQFLKRQGLQMMAILFGEMLQFALVLGTIMMGFTVSFFALFHESHSYGDVWLDVFKAMLGEVSVFSDIYEDSVYKDVARVLLVVYLAVVAVMLLNLLIAVLSTEHAKVDEQQDIAFRESKVRIMKLYVRIVDSDVLPSPFNLPQLTLGLLARGFDGLLGTRTCPKIMREFSVGVFWLTLGPPVILIAWGLWAASAPAAVLAAWRRATFTGRSLPVAVASCSVVVVLHVLLLPWVLTRFWVHSGLGLAALTLKTLAAALCGGHGGEDSSGRRVPRRPVAAGSRGASAAGSSAGGDVSIADMLGRENASPGGRHAGSSVAEIWAQLENPTTSDGLAQRQGEQNQTVTREEIIRARNHLDEAGRSRGEAVLALLKSVDADLKDQIAELERSVARSVESLRVGLEASVAALVKAEVAKAVEGSRDPSPREALSPAGVPRVGEPDS
ncbi:unnamed protein product [Ectocarpus fasciculatus]